jgi:hypothetical protein
MEDAIAAIARYRDDLLCRLDQQAAARLGTLIDRAAGPGGDRAVTEIADLVTGMLPPGHPVRTALLIADLGAAATEQVLRAPALTEEEVRRRGADPGDPGLLRLERPDGVRQWPEFQFTPGGGPRSVVRAVNLLLDAAGDPLGTAGWWLSGNGWLGGQPSMLLGTIADHLLIAAAGAIGAQLWRAG